MEVIRSQKRTASNDASSNHKIPLYLTAPQMEVRLEEFELFAIDRLRVLKRVSDGLARGKNPKEMDDVVDALWKEHMRHSDASEMYNKDIISHFVLRLVYCRSDELKKWFLSMETALFRHRFRLQNFEAQRATVGEFGLPYKAVTGAELESLKERLGQVVRSLGQISPSVDAVYYKVPFEEVPDLVAGRRVLIQKGFAFVAGSQLVSLVVTQYRSHISKALILTNRKWTTTIRDREKDRLTPIVEALSTTYVGPDYSQSSEYADISLKDIDQVAKSSFPLCMRHLFEKLREDHHLKHGGRMQLGLFLKGVGLKLDDALAFWRAEFSKKVGSERFDKEYAYGIRHNYGKEGKRTDYTPYACQKIISSAPGAGDHHGCPYRHFSEDNLRAALGRMGLSSRRMEDVMEKVRNKHYQLACTLTFEAVYGTSCDAGINHPNQYFEESQKILKSKTPAATPAYSFSLPTEDYKYRDEAQRSSRPTTNTSLRSIGPPHKTLTPVAGSRPRKLAHRRSHLRQPNLLCSYFHLTITVTVTASHRIVTIDTQQSLGAPIRKSLHRIHISSLNSPRATPRRPIREPQNPKTKETYPIHKQTTNATAKLQRNQTKAGDIKLNKPLPPGQQKPTRKDLRKPPSRGCKGLSLQALTPGGSLHDTNREKKARTRAQTGRSVGIDEREAGREDWAEGRVSPAIAF
ncbi:DNA primase large subunit [Hirschfeldia incana]|nr:DNA primase large subunit [Hirschfeldia incana]